MQTKEELRKYYFNIRKELNKKPQELVLEKLKNNSEFIKAKCVFCYVSAEKEPDTWLLLEEILKMKKILAVPKCLDKKGNMTAVEIDNLAALKKGCFGIYEPESGREIKKEEIDLCIVPGLAFDKKGFRLGYGGGYYDRFLKNGKFYSIGLCFSETFAKCLPKDEFDIPVDEVVIV